MCSSLVFVFVLGLGFGFWNMYLGLGLGLAVILRICIISPLSQHVEILDAVEG